MGYLKMVYASLTMVPKKVMHMLLDINLKQRGFAVGFVTSLPTNKMA